jgi:hypothetical protein
VWANDRCHRVSISARRIRTPRERKIIRLPNWQTFQLGASPKRKVRLFADPSEDPSSQDALQRLHGIRFASYQGGTVISLAGFSLCHL